MGVAWLRIEVIGVTSARPPTVDGHEGSATVFHRFDGTVRQRFATGTIASRSPWTDRRPHGCGGCNAGARRVGLARDYESDAVKVTSAKRRGTLYFTQLYGDLLWRAAAADQYHFGGL